MAYKFGISPAPVGTVTDIGGTQSTDASTGVVFSVILNAAGTNTLENPTNLQEGQEYTWMLVQDAVTDQDVEFGDDFFFAGGTAPTITRTPGAVDIVRATALDDGAGSIKLYSEFEPDVKQPPTFSNTYSVEFGEPSTSSQNQSEYLTGGNILDKDGSSSFTISMWLKVPASWAPALNFVLTKQQGGPGGYLGYQVLYSDGDGDLSCLSFGVVSNYPSAYWRYNTDSNTILTDGAWHHCAFVFRGTNTIPLIYVDGSSESLVSGSGALFASGSISSSADFIVGQRSDLLTTNSLYYTGYMDELAVFDDELTASEITAIYNLGTPTDLTGHDHLEAWWRMGDDASDDLTGGTGQLTDQVGSNNLTPYNTTSADKVTDVP